MAPETSPNPVVASDVGRIVPRTDGGSPAARMRPNANEMVRELARDTTSEHRAAADGWAAYERGDLENAARLLGQAAAEPGARPWIHYARGFALLGQRRQKEAADEWEQVRRDTPAFEPVYYDLADVYVQLGDETAAVSILRDAEKRWPASADVHNALGVIQVRRGALDDALDTFAKAVKAAPADSLGYFNLARAHHLRYFKSHRYHSTVRKWIGNERDREQAIAHFEKYVEMGGPYLQQARDALTTLGWK
jgi:tetratricopeptide (TPR) repeat protein